MRLLQGVLFIPDMPVLMPMMPWGMPRPYVSHMPIWAMK